MISNIIQNEDKSIASLQEYLELMVLAKPVASPAWEEEE